MKLNEFLIRELHQDRHLTSEVDLLFAEREVKRGDLLVREGSHTDRVLFFEQGIAREYIIANGVEVSLGEHLLHPVGEHLPWQRGRLERGNGGGRRGACGSLSHPRAADGGQPVCTEVHLPDVLHGHPAYVRDLAQPSVALGQRPLRAPTARTARHRAARPPRPHRLLPRRHPAAPQRHPPSGETVVAVSDRRLSSPSNITQRPHTATCKVWGLTLFISEGLQTLTQQCTQ